MKKKWGLLVGIRGANVRIADASVSLRFYDPQGCVQTYDFDFMKQLPLFVLMVMVFQRFTHCRWGFSQRDDTKIKIGNKTYSIDAMPKHHFQLYGGRQGFVAPVSCVKDN